MMNEKETRLIKQAQRGSIAAFEQLVALHDRQVLKLAFQMLGSQQDAEDVYQDIFIQVYRKLGSFRFQSQFSTWLYRIVVNYCINYRKKRTRRRHDSLEVSFNGEAQSQPREIIDETSDPEHHTLNTELRGQIDTALDSLSEQQRAVFVLRHFHGHKLLEIAQILNCAEGTVKNYLFRATRHLQKKLRVYREGTL